MMRNLVSFYSILCTLLLFAGCQKGGKSATFEVSVPSVALTNSSRDSKFTITTDQEWNVRDIPDWCTVKPESGSGNATVVISAGVSREMNEREATVQVTAGEWVHSVRIVQSPAAFKMTPERLIFNGIGETKMSTITSDTEWNVVMPDDLAGCTVSPMSGSGNATLEVTLPANPTHDLREGTVSVYVGKLAMPLMIRQESMENRIPTAPGLLVPSMSAVNVPLLPEFSWKASVDPDNDPVTYELQLSVDQESWTTVSVGKMTTGHLTDALTLETVYFWRVLAKDGFGGEQFSDVKSFTTSASGAYRDGEVRVFQRATEGNGIDIVFLGDGFIPADYVDSGNFDTLLDEGIEAFFSVEPFKSYRGYFNIYKVAAYSGERGASEGDKGIVKNTAFAAKYTGGSGMDLNRDKVGNYARKIPGMTEKRFQTLTMILVVNNSRFAGTTYMTASGRTIAVCPVNREELPRGYKNLIVHEGGGHAFGLLGDEYVNYQTEIPGQELAQIKEFMALGFYANLDFTGNREQVKWKHYFTLLGYERVGMFEGGYYYRRGLWHSEETGCMINNMSYHNAPSREAIVRRLKELSGETFSFDDFVSKDVTKAPPAEKLRRGMVLMGGESGTPRPVIVDDF